MIDYETPVYLTPEQIAANRRTAVEALRTTELPWGEGEFYDPDTGCYCALGVIAKALGFELDGHNEPWCAVEDALDIGTWDEAPVTSRSIYLMSDGNAEGHMSFAEIGDILATAWGIA